MMSNWISVKDRLPGKNIVIIYTKCETMAMAMCVKISVDAYQWNVFLPSGSIYLHGQEFQSVTHWMPLPEPPEIESESE